MAGLLLSDVPVVDTVSAEPKENAVYIVKEITPAKRPVYRFIKRLLDIVLAVVAGVILFLPMAVIALWVRLDSPGPSIYAQERLGKNGKPFVIRKFRTMVIDAEKNGPQWAERNDLRVTRVGKFLRNTRLDELPQLWNILVGEMSLVGPRPERPCFYEEFETYIHGFRNRLAVTPGLTGWAQVNGGYNLRPEEKVVYDMEYIENQSLAMDAKCVFQTVKLVFTHEGAR